MADNNNNHCKTTNDDVDEQIITSNDSNDDLDEILAKMNEELPSSLLLLSSSESTTSSSSSSSKYTTSNDLSTNSTSSSLPYENDNNDLNQQNIINNNRINSSLNKSYSTPNTIIPTTKNESTLLSSSSSLSSIISSLKATTSTPLTTTVTIEICDNNNDDIINGMNDNDNINSEKIENNQNQNIRTIKKTLLTTTTTKKHINNKQQQSQNNDKHQDNNVNDNTNNNYKSIHKQQQVEFVDKQQLEQITKINMLASFNDDLNNNNNNTNNDDVDIDNNQHQQQQQPNKSINNKNSNDDDYNNKIPVVNSDDDDDDVVVVVKQQQQQQQHKIKQHDSLNSAVEEVKTITATSKTTKTPLTFETTAAPLNTTTLTLAKSSTLTIENNNIKDINNDDDDDDVITLKNLKKFQCSIDKNNSIDTQNDYNNKSINQLKNNNSNTSKKFSNINLKQSSKSSLPQINKSMMAKKIETDYNENNNNSNNSQSTMTTISTSTANTNTNTVATSTTTVPLKSALKSNNNNNNNDNNNQNSNNEINDLTMIDQLDINDRNHNVNNEDDDANDNGKQMSIVKDSEQLNDNQSSGKSLPHWSQHITVYDSLANGDYLISGGSDYGQMPYFTETGDIIIEIDGEQVAGYTSYDIEQILARSPRHSFKVLTGQHGFSLELREFLSRRFVRGSLDHKLQELIRDNIYARTIPITTRPIRDGEIDGVDYRFVTKEQFLQMERSGLLLESGVYCNYYYGTALPSTSEQAISINNQATTTTTTTAPSNMKNDVEESWSTLSASAKRKRNRSNIVAIDAASLPYGWERISDSHYGVYYIDHINKRTQYERPYEIELVKGINGFGFTLIEIDKGLIVVKSLIQGGSAAASGVIQPGDVLVSVAGVSISGYQHSDIAQLFSTFNVGDRIRLTFARGYQLPVGINDEDYDIINLKIIKGFQGFGFTISEGHNGQKVKKILDIERCCSLRQGDILLSINGVDLSQLTHLDVVELLKQCPIDEPTEFMVKRKKRFRSKTPILYNNNNNQQQQPQTNPIMMINNNNNMNMNNSNDPVINPSIIRNCKTPNEQELYSYYHQKQQSQSQPSNIIYNHMPQQQLAQSMQQQQQYNTMSSFNWNINDDNNDNSNNNINNQIQIQSLNENSQIDQYQYDQLNNNNNNQNNIVNGTNIELIDDPLYSNQSQIHYNNYNHMMMINQPIKASQSAPILTTNMMNSNNNSNNINILNDQRLSTNSPFGQIDVDYDYHQVTLNRTDTGFGFRIIGGAEDGSNVAIGSIVIGGAAHLDGTLKAGDELIAINGQYVIGSSHQEVVQLMAQTGAQVTIIIRRKRYLNAYDVTLHRHDYEGFGFVIISCGNCALIGRIIEGSPAHRCQRLHVRDRIIAVNGVDVTNMSHPEIVNKIKESDDRLLLRIVPSDCYSCELIRGTNGYGFSIRGGAEFNGMPLFILAIAPNGPASSLLQVGDEILEINNRSTIDMTHQEAVQLISQSVPSVRLRMRHNYGNGEFFQQTAATSASMISLQQQQPQQPPPIPLQTSSSAGRISTINNHQSSLPLSSIPQQTAIMHSSQQSNISQQPLQQQQQQTNQSTVSLQFPSTKYPSDMINY